MEENLQSEKLVLYLYFITEGIFFFLIKWAEFTCSYTITGKIMYGSIVFNFCTMLFFYLRYRGDARIPMALSITLIADYFLTYTNTYCSFGVIFFIIVQIIYGWKVGYNTCNIFFRFVLFLILTILMYILGLTFSFCFLCGTSMAFLLGNVFCSWKNFFKKINHDSFNSNKKVLFLISMGLTLFAFCDLSIGLRTIFSGIPSMGFYYNIMNYSTWVFYLPSQVFLNLSYISDVRNKSTTH